MENQTIAYYNQNAASFIQGTVSVDFQTTQDKFLNALPGKRVRSFIFCKLRQLFSDNVFSFPVPYANTSP